MLFKILKKDVSKNKSITVVLCLFITLAAMLVSGGVRLFVDTQTALHEFFACAKPIGYVQMTTQEPDEKVLAAFVQNHEGILRQQTQEMLGIDNANIYYGEEMKRTPDSVMEYSFVTQNKDFDYLLDMNNLPVSVNTGEIGIPVYVMETVGLTVGESVTIQIGDFTKEFIATCYVRDSQMNPSMVSSKRFVVSEDDYEIVKNSIGETEYLVEFLLADGVSIAELESDYLAAGLPRGIGYDITVLRLMNMLSSGISLAILLLIGLLLILISVLCLRFTILAALEEEMREIGVMKAIGIAPKSIYSLYRVKYFTMAGVSCFAGFLLASVFSRVVTRWVQMYLGQPKPSLAQWLWPITGALFVFFVIAVSCNIVLRKMRKITPVNAIRGTDSESKAAFGIRWKLHKSKFPNINILLGVRDVFCRFRLYLISFVVLVLASFIMIVPLNILTTITSPGFTRYSGAGQSDIRIDLRHSEDIGTRFVEMQSALAQDTAIEQFSSSVIASYSVKTADGSFESFQIDNGDFSLFPMEYLSGRVPQSDDEIALSYLNSDALQKSTGDTLEVLVEGEIRRLTISGVYQDLTFGGRTAKANLPWQEQNALWYKVHIDLLPGADIDSKTAEYAETYYPAKVTGIEEYISQTFSTTIQQVKIVAVIAVVIGAVVCFLILALFYKMLMAKDRSQISTQKGLGFTTQNLRLRYISSSLVVLIISVTLGSAASLVLGEGLMGLMMSGIGVVKIKFILNIWLSAVFCPLLLSVVALAATGCATRSIRKMENYTINP